ncbi:unnamed protein product [Symbiodinium microadriaticum]|nr:unnamed protein product [Symbiodinium microadriaticum]
MHAREVKGQGPVDLLVSLPRDRVLGFDYVVPFLLDLTSSSERGGQVGLKLFRLGCVEMLEFCNFQRLQQGLPLVTQTSEDEGDEKTTSGVKGEKRNHPHRSKYSAEELVSLHALQPRLAVVVDRTAAAFAPGETLLSVQVGVAGKETSDPNSASSIPPQPENAGRPIDIRSSKCSLSAQSTNHIRVAMSTPELHATVLVPLTLQFMLDHFEDTDMLMECVGIVASSAGIHSAAALAKKREALGRYALFATRLLTLLKKYLSSPQLQVSTQAAVRVIANGRDVVICLENEFQDKAVLQLNAVVNLKEVVDDVLGLAKAFVKGTSASSVGTKN